MRRLFSHRDREARKAWNVWTNLQPANVRTEASELAFRAGFHMGVAARQNDVKPELRTRDVLARFIEDHMHGTGAPLDHPRQEHQELAEAIMDDFVVHERSSLETDHA